MINFKQKEHRVNWLSKIKEWTNDAEMNGSENSLISIGNFTPAANISESPKKLKIDLSISGYSKKDIEVKRESNILRVSMRSISPHHEDDIKHLTEFDISGFERTFIIPERFRNGKMTVHYKHGLLKIKIMKL